MIRAGGTEMHHAALMATLLAALSGPAVAQSLSARDFDGDWTMGDPAACALYTDSVNFAFRIENGTLQGLESSCEMQNPVAVRDMAALLFDMNCVGEGDTWTYRALLMRAGVDDVDQLVFLQNGGPQILTRCTRVNSPAAAQATK